MFLFMNKYIVSSIHRVLWVAVNLTSKVMEINICWIPRIVFYFYKPNYLKEQMGIKEEA